MNNPTYEGLRVKTGLDLFAKGFTGDELEAVYDGLSSDAEAEALLMESATLDEIENEYNPGIDMVLEAVKVRRFSQTKRRMEALVRALNKNFDGITAQDAMIGKVRKTGLFASVTVQIPLSDGQVISIIFHSPDNDNSRIAPDDEIIAFRWVLNKRDITQAVSSEEGREVSLEQISKRITQIAAKNSEKFQKRQKQVGEQKAELRTAKADLEIANTTRDELLMDIRANEEDAQGIDDQISITQERLDAAIAFNASLQEQIDNLKTVQADQEAEKAEIRKLAKAAEENAELKDLEKEALRLGMNGQNLDNLRTQGIDALRGLVKRLQEEEVRDAQAEETKRLMQLGQENVPGIQLGDAEEAGRLWETKERGDLSQEDWDKYVADLYATGRARKPEPVVPNPESKPEEETPSEEPAAVQMLRNIIDGDLDDDPDALDQALDRAAEELEEAGLMGEYDELLNEAADHYTVVLEQLKEAA